MSAIIPVESLPAKELVEFWSYKYAEVKRELDQLKAQHQLARSTVVETRLEELLIAFKRESRWREEDEEKTRELVGRLLQDAQLSERLTTLERTNHELRQRLNVCENEREMLRKQATTMRSHSIALAVETHRWRCSMLARAGLTKRVDRPDSDYSSLAFTSPSTIMAHLPQQFSERHRCWIFVPAPPRSLPLRVSKPGDNGYWFYPVFRVPEHFPFELLVESVPDSWTYFGSYVSGPLPGFEMTLSEWMMLDDQTKDAHCERVFRDIATGPCEPVQDSIRDIRARYDTGETTVSCHSLQCVEYDATLYDALHKLVRSLSSSETTSPRSIADATRRHESQSVLS